MEMKLKSNFLLLVILSIKIAASQDVLSEMQIQPLRASGIIAGTNFMMTCTYPNFIESVRWLDLDGKEITKDTEGVVLEEETGRLYLTLIKVSSDMNGIYTCIGFDTKLNKSIDVTRTVSVFEPVSFVDTPKLQTFELGDTAVVVCKAQGNPSAEIYWKKGDISIDGEEFINRVYVQKLPLTSLVIENITKADEGTYTCIAKELTKGQNIDQKISVDVQFSPAAIQVPKLVEGVENENVTLTCNATGEPEPTYSWYKNNVSLTDGLMDGGKKLMLVGVKSDQAGQYTCFASNYLGNTSDKTEVRILVPPKIIFTKNASIEEGENDFISCSATGNPTPNVYFSYKDIEIQPTELNDTGSKIAEYSAGEAKLSFETVSAMDGGDYFCKAINSAGNAESIVPLDVFYGPRNTTLSTVEACNGQSAQLVCFVDSNPIPTLQWGQMELEDFDDLFIEMGATVTPVFKSVNESDNVKIVQENGKLLLNFLSVSNDDYGVYYCKAANGYGIEKTFKAELLISTKPLPPTNIKALDVTTQSVNVVFSPPSQIMTTISAYQILITGNGESKKYKTDAGVNGNTVGDILQYKVDALEHNTDYSVSVAAINCQGVGNDSSIMAFKTVLIMKPGKLLVSKGTKSSPNYSEYLLQWEPVNDGGGNIESISFTYSPVQIDPDNNTGIEPIVVVINPTDEAFINRQLVITDLNPSTEYEVTANISNEVGFTTTTTKFITGQKYQAKLSEKVVAKELESESIANILVTTSPDTLDGRLLIDSTEPVEETTQSNIIDQDPSGASSSLIIGLIIAALFIILLAVDIAFCFAKECGLCFCLSSSLCGSSKKKLDNKDAEEGSAEFRKDNKVDEVNVVLCDKQPLADDAQPVANGAHADKEGIANEETTPLNSQPPPATENGDKPTTVNSSLMKNEQPTPANSPLDSAAEPEKKALAPDDVAVTVANANTNGNQGDNVA